MPLFLNMHNMATRKARKNTPRKLTKAGKPAKKTGRKPIVPKNTPRRRASIAKFKEDVESGKIAIKQSPYSYVGRPRIYNNVQELIDKCEQYFTYIEGEKEIRKTKIEANNLKGYVEVEEEVVVRKSEPPTVMGFCLFLGFHSRSTLMEYKRDEREYSDVIKHYLARVAYGYEINLHGGKPFGSMFALGNINSKDWRHKQGIEGSFSEDTLQAIKSFNYIVPVDPNTKVAPPDPRDETQDFLK